MDDLLKSIENWYIEKVKRFIKKGIDINIKDKNERTALIYAVSIFDLELVKLTIDAGADVNAKNKNGKTALMIAVHHNNINIIKTLVKAGADILIKDKHGKTALDIAIKEAKKSKLDKDIKIYKKYMFIVNYLSTALKEQYDKKIDNTIVGTLSDLSL